MFRRASLAVALLGATVLAFAPAAQAAGGAKTFNTKLSGAAVPEGGDPNGRGSASVIAIPSENRVCFTLTVRRIDPADGAHIHKGAVGEVGPVVITLVPPADGSSDGCVDARDRRVDDLVANPDDYYVNVHNNVFHAGAVRGQLG